MKLIAFFLGLFLVGFVASESSTVEAGTNPTTGAPTVVTEVPTTIPASAPTVVPTDNTDATGASAETAAPTAASAGTAAPTAASAETAAPTAASAETAAPTAASAETAAPTAAGGSTVTGVTGETTAASGDQTTVPAVTTTTEPPTTTVPLNRNVSFNVDCAAETSCKFTFTIDERLVRSINNTALEVVLSELSSSINNASANLQGITYNEDVYSQYLNTQIDIQQDLADSLTQQYNETSVDVDTLSSKTSESLATAQAYLKSALCFQNDADSSIGCGSIAGLS